MLPGTHLEKEEVLLQLYTPADVFADVQVWCGEPGDTRPAWPERAWYVLQGEVFGQGLPAQLPYLRFGNQREPGLRFIAYDAAAKRVCAVGMCEARSRAEWSLTYYFALSGARTTRVVEAVLPSVTTWLIKRAAALESDTTLQGEVDCSDDGCRWVFAYRATPQGRLFTQDSIAHS